MNRENYDCAFNLLEAKVSFENELDAIGLNFEYGIGPVGKFMEAIFDSVEPIIKNELGLVTEFSVPAQTTIDFIPVVTNVYIYTTEDSSKEWSITADNFYEFFYKAIKNKELRDLMWKAMTEKDLDAKAKFNELMAGDGIGTYNW